VIDVKARVTITGPLSMLRHIARFDPRPVFQTLRKFANADQRQHDTANRAPDGPWPQLAASTVLRNRYNRTVKGLKGKRTIRLGGSTKHKLLGRVPKALQDIVSSRSLIVRNRVRWGLAHQAGAIVGHGARLPRRQFEWISRWLLRMTEEKFTEALQALANKAP